MRPGITIEIDGKAMESISDVAEKMLVYDGLLECGERRWVENERDAREFMAAGWHPVGVSRDGMFLVWLPLPVHPA